MEVDLKTWIEAAFPVGRRVRVLFAGEDTANQIQQSIGKLGIVDTHHWTGLFPIRVKLDGETGTTVFRAEELEPLD